MDPEVLRAIDARLHALETKGAVDEVHRCNVEKRLSGIEDTQKWLVRLILGAWIMSAVAYAIKGGFLLG